MDADTKRRQEHFDIVWQRFVVEEAPPSTDGETCLYEGPDRTTCAFGALLTDGERERAREDTSARDVIESLGLHRFHRSDGGPDGFYDEMQDAHDRAAFDPDTDERFSAEIKVELGHLAAKYDLTVPEATHSPEKDAELLSFAIGPLEEMESEGAYWADEAEDEASKVTPRQVIDAIGRASRALALLSAPEPAETGGVVDVAAHMQVPWVEWVVPRIANRIRDCDQSAPLESFGCDCMTYIRGMLVAAIRRGAHCVHFTLGPKPVGAPTAAESEGEALLREPDMWQVQIEGDAEVDAFTTKAEAEEWAASELDTLREGWVEEEGGTGYAGPIVNVYPVWIGSPLRALATPEAEGGSP